MADAYLLYSKLNARFGDILFWDIEKLDGGVLFKQKIIDTLEKTEALIVVIGKQWLTIEDDSGNKRLYQADDLLRYEVATALKKNILVIPVLVGGAKMPSKDELPDDLKTLTDRNGVILDYRSYD